MRKIFGRKVKFNSGMPACAGRSAQAGLSYVELIVVLTIFSVLSGIIVYNYALFQSKVELKNLASDIAGKITEAQKTSLSGILPTQSVSSTWKPTYGVYFNTQLDNKKFIYFVDTNQDGYLNDTGCEFFPNECVNTTTITKGNRISSLAVVYQGSSTETTISDLNITFTRPDSSAIIRSTGISDPSTISYVVINIISPKAVTSKIKVYPSGRIDIDSTPPANQTQEA